MNIEIPSAEPSLPSTRSRVVRWGIASFLGISVAAAAIILRVTRPDLGRIWALMQPAYLLPLAATVVAMWFFDFMRLKSLARALGEPIPFGWGMESVFINLLFCALTPFEGGGGPMQVVWLRLHGVSTARGFAMSIVKAMSAIVLVAVTGITIYLRNPALIPDDTLRPLFITISVAIALYIVFVMGSLLMPRTVKRVIHALVRKVDRIRWSPHRRVEIWEHKALDWVDRFHESMETLFTARKLALAENLFWTVAFLFALFLTGPLCLWLFGIPVGFGLSMEVMSLLHFMMYFLPTPGASGVGEGGFALLFAPFSPLASIGVATIVWRLTTYYTGIVIGGAILVTHTGKWAGKRWFSFLHHPRQGR